MAAGRNSPLPLEESLQTLLESAGSSPSPLEETVQNLLDSVNELSAKQELFQAEIAVQKLKCATLAHDIDTIKEDQVKSFLKNELVREDTKLQAMLDHNKEVQSDIADMYSKLHDLHLKRLHFARKKSQ